MSLQRDPERNEIRYLRNFVDLSGRRVLEIGSGEGRLTWQYAKWAGAVIAIDPDLDSQRVAKVDMPHDLENKVHLSAASSEYLPFSKEKFDLALLAWSLWCFVPAGMVHALEEVRRVLVPEGFLIDMRPLADRWRVEVVSTKGSQETGRVDDLPDQVSGDEAANQAMQEVEASGWFRREAEEIFPFFYSWDTPSEMEEFVEEDWGGFIELDDEAKRKTRSHWALADADSRVRIRVNILITRWKKL